MEYLSWVTFLIAFSGYIIGVLLHYTTGDEVKQGRAYLLFFQEIIIFVFVLLGLALFNAKPNLLSFVALIIGFLIPGMRYFYFGIMMPTLTFLPLSLIFLYGMPKGSCIEKKKKIILKNVFFNLFIFLVGIMTSFVLYKNFPILMPFTIYLLFGSFLAILLSLENGEII